MLLKIDEIKAKLDEKFLPLEPVITGLRMVDSSMNEDILNDLERSLGTSFPFPFRKLLLQYDFGRLTIGPVVFGTTGDYDKILNKYNLSEETKWWRGGSHSKEVIMIANSDPYAICLNCTSGEVLAFLHEKDLKNSVSISSCFDKFISGIGTVFFKRLEIEDRTKLVSEVVLETESKDLMFWSYLAE
ncbi:MAG: SMI1/KNR4 family protein [Clostridiales bacterium]|nr:SMI1/KNR4 family protein [Clostridiales bacterium]